MELEITLKTTGTTRTRHSTDMIVRLSNERALGCNGDILSVILAKQLSRRAVFMHAEYARINYGRAEQNSGNCVKDTSINRPHVHGSPGM